MKRSREITSESESGSGSESEELSWPKDVKLMPKPCDVIVEISFNKMAQSLQSTMKEVKKEGSDGRPLLSSVVLECYEEKLLRINGNLTGKKTFDRHNAIAALNALRELIGDKGSEVFPKELSIMSTRYLLMFCYRFCKWVSDNLDSRESKAGNKIFSNAHDLTRTLHDKWDAIYFNHQMECNESSQLFKRLYDAHRCLVPPLRDFLRLAIEGDIEYSSVEAFTSAYRLIQTGKGSMMNDIFMLNTKRNLCELGQVIQRIQADGVKLRCIFDAVFSRLNESDMLDEGPVLSGLKDFLKALSAVKGLLNRIKGLVDEDRKNLIDDIYPPRAQPSIFVSTGRGEESHHSSSSLQLNR